MKRIAWIDALRGFAVFFMIFTHLINVLSVHSIYTDPPYYSRFLDTPLPFIPSPPILFTFISGMCVYISMRKRNFSLKGWIHIVKRYGSYILLSLLFTSFVFGFGTFLGWNEAIQGIGLTAIFFAALLLLPDAILAIIAISLAIANQFVWFECNSVACAPFFGGFFSVANLLPIMIAGYLFFKRKVDGRYGFILIFIALLLHLAGIPISYFQRTANYKLFAIGMAMVFAYMIQAKPLRILQNFGRLSVIPYVLHFVLIYKPIETLGIKMPDIYAIPLAFLLTLGVYGLTVVLLKIFKVKEERK